MSNMHIVVSGGTGYLGSNLVNLFVNKGFKITVLIRNQSSIHRINKCLNRINLVNIGDSEKIEHLFKNESVDGVIHTATCYGRKSEALDLILESNVVFPKKLFKLAIENNLSFFINTDTSLPRQLNSYSFSKAQFRDWFKSYSNEIKIINVIPEYIYGPNDDEIKFVTNITNKLINNSDSIEFSTGEQLRDFVYIDDVVNAYFYIIKNLVDIKTLTNIPIGTSEVISLKNLVFLIKEKLGNIYTKLNFGYLPTRPGEAMISKADITLMKSFGWSPKIMINQGIQKIIKLQKINNI
jgi:CDP-paratose synthetase